MTLIKRKGIVKWNHFHYLCFIPLLFKSIGLSPSSSVSCSMSVEALPFTEYFLLFFFLAALCGLQDLSSSTRD